jgi:hypothetical protein
MTENPDYKEGSHSQFIEYLFRDSPKDKGSIQLESTHIEPDKNIGLHTFEQLLMIFVDGLKYFYGNSEGKVTISELKKEDIEKVNEYFVSMNYKVNLDVFSTMNDYKFKFPNYFKNQEHIKSGTKLEDFYYEIFGQYNCAFRISFENYI